ncbi:protein kinase domain-containing protein [Streptomyces sp. 6N223]|uniref:protein kinase domain-containing protein n=1 Tax=Streptomyces sp. 6N223 TaxID=3457412 RepID=UPI003FD0F394
MAQERGAAGSGDREPEAAGGHVPDAPGTPRTPGVSGASETPEVPDAPELFGNNGLVGEGRYRLTHRLGRGGMAEVFAAEDVRLGRPVAVKLLRADLAEDPVSKARFTREAQSVAGLNHHAVVAVYDSGEEFMPLPGAGRGSMVPYMVMELVHGHTIRELLLNAEAPPPEQALIIVSGVLEALAYSHQHGIVHRDIKPANVIITETGTVKVMDFGIARALHGAAQTMTATGMVMGTPQYLSPEQALGKTVDTRSDLYAVGCLLYELLALRPPFVGETPLAVVYQHVQDIAPPPSEVNASVPPELDGLVVRSLAKDPDDRFQTAEEMRGLVQYALRMLEEHGSHTGGLWNTGPAVPGGTGATPPMGSPAVTAPGRRGPSTPPTAITSQIRPPMLLGDPGGGGHGGHGDPGPDGRRRGRMILVALLAVVAIGTGVLVAANLGGGQEEGGRSTDDTSQTDDPTDENPDEAENQGQGQDSSDPAAETTDEDSGEDDDVWTPPETTPEETETLPSPTVTETEPTAPETTEETTPEATESETEPTPTDVETETEEPTEDPTTADPTPTEEEGTVDGTVP